MSDDGGALWTAFPAYTGLTGTNASSTFESLNVSSLGGSIDDFTGSLSVRFRVDNGYTLASQFNVGNVELRTGTTDCGVGLMDHYLISHNTNGIACLGSDITIVGHDASHAPIAPGNGEIMTLSNNRGKGTWASTLVGIDTLVDIGSQGDPGNTDGIATYTWVGAQESVQLRFNYTDPSTDPESVNFELSGSFFEQEVAGHDDDLFIYQAGLRFYNESQSSTGISTQISGKPSDVYGTDDVIVLQALRTDDLDPTACLPLFTDTQVVAIEFAAECDDPGTCSVTAPLPTFTVDDEFGSAQPIALQDSNGGAGAAVYTSVDVQFTLDGGVTRAVLAMSYSDAGQIELHARYDIPFNSDPNFPITSEDFLVGNSTFVVRPFGFDVDFLIAATLDRKDNAGALSLTDPALPTGVQDGPAFAKAGDTFSATVTARAWDPTDDTADSDGVPDPGADLTNNATTPNFGAQSVAEDVVVTHNMIAPVGGIQGNLTGGTSFTSFTAGTDTQDLSYDEVGVINLTAHLADSDFMESGDDVQGAVINVGRFYPDHFVLDAGAFAAVCTAVSGFTYMGEAFAISFDLDAKAVGNNTTENYTGDFVRLYTSQLQDSSIYHAVAENGGSADVDHSARVLALSSSFLATYPAAGVIGAGKGTITGQLIFDRQVTGVEDGPYTVSIATTIVDDDTVAIDPATFDIDIDGAPAIYKLIGNSPGSDEVNFRYGRLLIDNAFGPETEPLEIPIRVEYWDGANFVVNTDDGCTVIEYIDATPAIDFVAGSFVDDITNGNVSIEPDTVSNFTITLGNGQTTANDTGTDPGRSLILSAPSGEEIGGAMVELNLSDPTLNVRLDHLQYDWRALVEPDPYDDNPDGSYSDNPRAVIEYGSYRGHDRVINWQEIYIGPGL